MLNKLKRIALSLLMIAPLLAPSAPANALSDQQELIERSRLTFLKLIDHPDFPELKQRLVAHGAELIPPIRETPFARFFFRDPNGYMFEVIDSEGYVRE